VVETLGDFQLIYYGDKIEGGDQHKRDRHKGHRFFDDCAEFCERWDQSSFDPEYDTLPLDFFRDMVREVFARTPYDPAVMNAPAQPLQNPTEAANRAAQG
jgi:predicted HD phosphohydrolase